MGLMKRLHAESQKVQRGRSSRAQRKLGVVIEATDDTLKALDVIPVLMKEKVLKKAVRKAAAPVRQAARGFLTPHRSKNTGTEERLSQKQRQSRADTQHKDLYDSIAVSVKSNQSGVLAMVGPRRPFGNHGSLIEFGWQMYFWGEDAGQEWDGTGRGFLRRASELTKAEQDRNMLDYVKSQWDEV